MKAIYLNLDPYLAAIAAWIEGGKSGPAPTFDQTIPLAVTIPLGETACIYAPGDAEGTPAGFDVAGTSVYALGLGAFDPTAGTTIADGVAPGLSQFSAPSGGAQVYGVIPVTGDITATFVICDNEATPYASLSIPVLVRREQASGPVDLVDFTPPASAPTAAQINTALGGTGAEEGAPLAGVLLNGAKYLKIDADDPSRIYESSDVTESSPALVLSTPGS